MIRRASFLAFVLCVTVSTSAVDWSAFRGPTGDGRATSLKDIPVRWSATTNVVWKKPIPGKGWSSPVLNEGRIYLTAAVPDTADESSDHSLQCLILSAKTGEQLKQIEVFQQDGASAPRIHGKNSHASPTPLVHGDQVFVHFGHQGIACLDLNGKMIWRNQANRYEPVHGNGGSPIMVGDALIFSCDGRENPFVVALDRHTGETVWKTTRQSDALKKFSFTTPTLLNVDGKGQVISAGSNVVCAFDATTGSELWRVRYDGYSVIPKPVFGHGLIFVCTGYDRPSLLAIRTGGQGDVTDTHVVWKTDRAVPHTSSLLLVDDDLYMISDRGIASCLDARSGAVHWQERLGGSFSASPLFCNGLIYFQDEAGTATVIKASTGFERVAQNSINERTLASYAVSDGALFLRSEKHLYRLEAP